MANYTFLPFLRRGIVGLANANTEKNRLIVPLRLQVIGEGEAPTVPIERNTQLYGPGDVTGLNFQAIIRTVPRAGVRDFEANFLAAIEFYDEDFLWRYSPMLHDTAGKIQPWLWLTVMEESEYLRLQGGKNQLPAIEIMSDAVRSAFPNPDTAAAWAHVHLNFKPEGATPKALGLNIQQKLDSDPNLGCSRLVCPRRLKPNVRYTAFLLPAFEKGRLAGLGRPESEIANVANAQPAWAKIAANASVGTLKFPVYYEWEFSTALEGDFEDLARKLGPLSISEQKDLTDAAKRIDVRNPGWGIKGAKGTIRMESALKLPNLTPDSLEEISDKKVLSEKISPLLNLGVVPLNGTTSKNTPHPYFKSQSNPTMPSNLEDDPIITPPLYGSFYRPGELLSPATGQNWYSELNLNPAYRIAAAQGTGVIQRNQEEFMDSAWGQLDTYIETWKTRSRWTFSEQLSQTMCEKRMLPMLNTVNQAAQYHATSFFSSLLPTITATGGTTDKFTNQMLSEAEKPSTLSRSFSKITRTGGPLMRRMGDKPTGVLFFNVTVIFAQVQETPLQKAANAILFWLNNNPNQNEQLKNIGLAGVEQLKTAVSLLLPPVSLKSSPITRKKDVHTKAMVGMWAQINPKNTIMARFETMRGNSAALGVRALAATSPIGPVFKEPTYKYLSEGNTDFILPGLDKIPQNRVAILQTNNAFIESYLMGLNHEMAREFLWREFPTPLNATFFDQFWDGRDTVNTNPDIQPILNWQINKSLGKHGQGGGQGGGGGGQGGSDNIVVVIRGDLLRKYPNTEIFMVKADWENQQLGSHKLTPELNKPEDWTNNSPNLRRPIFSARIEPDYVLLGFNLGVQEVKGDTQNAGWFFVMKERAGDVHFGLDLKADKTVAIQTDPSWEKLAEVGENQCIQADSPKFIALPRFGKRADQIASMLWQQPFMLLVHASRLLP